MCNIMGGQLNALHWRDILTTHNIAGGTVFDAGNTNRIFRLNANGTCSSYRPGRSINAFTTMPVCDGSAGPKTGQMYLIDAISDIDFNANSQIPVWVCDDMGMDLSPTVLADDVTPWLVSMGNDKIPNFALFSGTVVNSTQSGNWSSSSTWGGSTPAAGNVIRIRSGHTVTYDNNNTTSYKVVSVENGGTLAFSVAGDTKLRVQHFLVRETGTLTMGTVGSPVPNGTTCTVEFANVAVDTTNDPAQFGNGLVVLGTWTACGYDRGLSFIRATGELSASDATITLASAATNWQVGDRIVIPDSRQLATTDTFAARLEVRTISSFSSGNTVLHLSSALTYAHPGARDDAGTLTGFLPHVFNTTANVILKSVDATGTPGHVLATDRADVNIQDVLFFELARTLGDDGHPLDSTTFSGNTPTHIGTNQIGRYPLHFHHVGGRTANGDGWAFEVKNCKIDGGDDLAHFRKWGFTVHGTHYGLLQNCVVFNAFGGGIVTEDGSETGNWFDGNGVVYVPGYAGREDRDDIFTGFARNGVGYWSRMELSRYTNNVAANCAGYGRAINGLGMAATVAVPSYQGSYRMMDYVNHDVRSAGNRQFEDFEGYGSPGGATFWNWNNYSFYTPTYASPWCVWNRCHFWHAGAKVVYAYPGTHIDYRSWVVRGAIANLANDNINVAFHWGDYRMCNQRIINCDVSGVKWGVECSPDIFDRLLVEDSTILAGIGVNVWSAGSEGSLGADSAQEQRERAITIRNCTLTPTTNSVSGGVVPTKYEVLMQLGPSSANASNYVVLGRVFVESRNGVDGADFQLFRTQQASDYVMGQSTVEGRYECPEAGLTNAQAWAKYEPWVPPETGLTIPVKSDNPNPNSPGLAFNGEMAPDTATTASWTNALVESL